MLASHFDILYLFAEIAIGIAGFTAVVVAFKERANEAWPKREAMILLGMIIHCSEALIFSLLPVLLLSVFTQTETVWRICSFIIGITTFIHMFQVLHLERDRGRSVLLIVIIELLISGALIANTFLSFADLKGLYVIGVFIHIFQSMFLFIFMTYSKVFLNDPADKENQEGLRDALRETE